MKTILALIFTTISLSSFAKTTFECRLDNDSKNSFTFIVHNLGAKNVELELDPDDEIGPFKTEALEESFTWDVVGTLNGQGGDPRTIEEGLYLYGDAVGCSFVHLVLYKNAAYKRGYLKAKYLCADLKDEYTLVRCSVK